jgi:hypothetical protein
MNVRCRDEFLNYLCGDHMQNLPRPNTFFIVIENGSNETTSDRSSEYRNYAYDSYMALMLGDESGKELSQSDIDEVLKCPITLSFFADPVITPSGQTYEGQAIRQWIQENNTDPLSRDTLDVTQLRPNTAIKQIVDELIQADERPSSELERGMGKRTFVDVFAAFKERLRLTFSMAAQVATLPLTLGAGSLAAGTAESNEGNYSAGATLSTAGVASVGIYAIPTASLAIGGAALATVAGGLAVNTVATSADATSVSFQGSSQAAEQDDTESCGPSSSSTSTFPR